jgi:hypothetical protein
MGIRSRGVLTDHMPVRLILTDYLVMLLIDDVASVFFANLFLIGGSFYNHVILIDISGSFKHRRGLNR